jgi:anti-sigma28 factor (negative regulator of flagellin synthesis)
LYDRAIGDLFLVRDCHKQEQLPGADLDELEQLTAERCWAIFDDFMGTYRWGFIHFNESRKLYRDIRQQRQVGELISRTRAKQFRAPYIDDVETYLDKSQKLYMYLYERLAPVQGARTINVYYDKIADCRALWEKYGFTPEENEAIPGLIDNLRTEWALISVDRKPNFTATQQDQPTEQQAKVAEPTKPSKKTGRPKADWTQEDKKIIELSRQGMKPQEIASKLRLPNLVTEKKIRALKRRIKDGNPPK